MSRSGLITLHEHFYAFQGEGVHMGRAAHFLRTYGCDQKCHFCDAAGTWHPDHIPAGMSRLSAPQLAALTENDPEGAIVVLTGGEPAMYDLDPLVGCLQAQGRYVTIETAGHRPLPERIDWITLSPKPFAKPPLTENVERANEFKVIVSDRGSLNDGLDSIAARNPLAPVWLHPEWSHTKDPYVLELISETVKAHPSLRAGWQLHKLYMVDLMDPRARTEPVPLGGISGSPY